MRAILQRPEEAAEKYADPDDRDEFSVEQRIEELYERVERYEASVNAGGPPYTRSHGYVWADYSGRGGDNERDLDADLFRFAEQIMGAGKLSVIGGPKGSGKSLIAVWLAKLLNDGGYRVISNIGVDFQYKVEGAADMLSITRSPLYTVWIWDELHMMLPKMAMGRRYNREAVGSLTALRKQQSGIGGVTSQPGNVDTAFMEQVEWFLMASLLRPPPPGKKFGKAKRKRRRTEAEWRDSWAVQSGPEPWRADDSLEKMLKLDSGRPPVRQRAIMPGHKGLEEAARCYGSFDAVPTRAQSGVNLTATHVKDLDLDSPIELLDVLDFGDEQGAGQGQADDAAGYFQFVTAVLNHAIEAANKAGLTGRQRIAELRSTVLTIQNINIDEKDMERVLKDYCAAERGAVVIEKITEALERIYGGGGQ